MSLPYSSSIPADDPAKVQECLRAGVAIRNLLEKDIKPRDIMTRKAFENAITIIMVLGGMFDRSVSCWINRFPLRILCRIAIGLSLVLSICAKVLKFVFCYSTGSTNAVMHMIAVAKAAGVHLTLDDFQIIADKTPFLADLRPRLASDGLSIHCSITFRLITII